MNGVKKCIIFCYNAQFMGTFGRHWSIYSVLLHMFRISNLKSILEMASGYTLYTI